MSTAADIERRVRLQLAHALHDGPLQSILGVKMMIEAMATQADAGKATRPQDLHQLVVYLSDAILDLRHLVTDLRPFDADMNWDARLKAWLSRAGERFAKVKLDLQEPLPQVSAAAHETLFRVSCEAILNAQRHARANSIVVSAVQRAQEICLEIFDDGNGFEPQQLPADHYGVRGMIERVEALQGWSSIESGAGQGTRVRIRLPCEESSSGTDEIMIPSEVAGTLRVP